MINSGSSSLSQMHKTNAKFHNFVKQSMSCLSEASGGTQQVCNLKLISYNCQSLRSKVHQIMDTVSEHNIEICFVRETWFMKSDTAMIQETHEYGYEMLTERLSRLIARGSRVAAMFKRNSDCKSAADKSASFDFMVL